MTTYNSQRVNNDPQPYLWRSGERTESPSVWGNRPPHTFNPRPEYENNPNPVLEAFRKHGPGLFGGTEGWLQYAMPGTHVDRVPFTEAHLEHAHRVLTKLINVYKETA